MIAVKYPSPASSQGPAAANTLLSAPPLSMAPSQPDVEELSPKTSPPMAQNDVDESSQSEPTSAKSVEDTPAVESRPQDVAKEQNGTEAQAPELTVQTSGVESTGARPGSAGDEDPRSVIHAPSGFGQYPSSVGTQGTSGESVSDKSIATVVQPCTSPLTTNGLPDKTKTTSPVSPHALTTSIGSPSSNWTESATPRAHTRQEVEHLTSERRQDSLEGIPEDLDTDGSQVDNEDDLEDRDIALDGAQNYEDELSVLRNALSECWSLCNTLATLSMGHRERLFRHSGKSDKHEHAWKTCWRLCQTLYDYRGSNQHAFNLRPTLDLCRQFCQALFDIRSRENEMADSVLRVSFELNNHLYNTHDRDLPDAFRERTLDFYITLCHRLMKQRAGLGDETDSLLRACWSLAEMLFNLRRSEREGRHAGEDVLGLSVQACWELCDLFREGWTQIRPDRRSSPASQNAFAQAFYQARRRESSRTEDTDPAQANPETPTTIFEDTATVAADEDPLPNIVVLGSGVSNYDSEQRWSSKTSTLSAYSQGSSTRTLRSQAEDPNLTCLKLLVVRAAMSSGFQRRGPQTLRSFVKALPSDSFGTSPWQTALLRNYRKLVTADQTFRNPPPPSRASAAEVARALQFMTQHTGQYLWLSDLYRWVFGFRIEEAVQRSNVAIQI